MSRLSRRFRSSLAPLALGLVLLVGCSASSTHSGSVQLAASVPQALSASDVTRIKVTVSAPDMSAIVVELAKSNGVWGGLIGNIPAGSNRSFLAEAFDASGTKRFQGSASGVTITANQTTAVALTLQELVAPLPYANEAPVIDSAVASSTSVQTGGSLSLTATVHDPNAGDTLTLAWSASGGSFSAPTTATSSWTAPASPGVQTLTFTVTDSQGAAVSVSLTINVLSGVAIGNAAVDISFNLWPLVSKVSASLNRLDAGQSTSVSSIASDADGDALSYQWTASCPGTWTNATSSAASFVPSSVPAGLCNNCLLTVTVQDGRGGQNTGSLNLCVASSSTQRFPPTFTNFYQSSTSASPSQSVSFDVTALDSQASSLTFAWTAGTGSLATAQSTATTSHTVWTAPSCVTASNTASITATVTNAFNLTATKSFEVTGLPFCAAGWAAANAMATPRYGHTGTQLNNGKILIVGGNNASGTLQTAEVYDPALGTWSTTGAMATHRYQHRATLLSNGKVLVTGGSNASGYVATAEVYDPSSGTWTAAGTMASPRYFHTATLMPDGKVLIVGGYNSSGLLSAAELYNPATGTWNTTGSMASSRFQHTTTLLPNGTVLVSGGGTYGTTVALASAEVYDPAAGTWSSSAPMSTARRVHTATLLPSGKVLIAGGIHNSTRFATTEIYDPAVGTWSAAASMATARREHTATLLSNGKLLVAGGNNSSGLVAAAEVYDPASDTWISAGAMASSRDSHTATLLPTGRVIVSGGYTGSSGLTGAELYTP